MVLYGVTAQRGQLPTWSSNGVALHERGQQEECQGIASNRVN